MVSFHGIFRRRMTRRAYIPLMAVLLGAYGAFLIGVGMPWGLRNVLPVFVPVTAVALALRIIISAARWRSVGAGGLGTAAASTAVCIAAIFFASPTWTAATVFSILLLESALPPKHMSDTKSRHE